MNRTCLPRQQNKIRSIWTILGSSFVCIPNILEGYLPRHLLKSIILIRFCFILVLWDIFFGIPVSFLIVQTNIFIFTSLGYEKIMRCPSGILGNRILFIAVNVLLVVAWTVQLVEEDQRVCWESQFRLWDARIQWLERELEKVHELEVCICSQIPEFSY